MGARQDRAFIGLLVYTFARVGAAVAMKLEDFYPIGHRWWVRLHEKAQAIAAHESPRTTKLYDRSADQITLDEVERIVL